MRFAALPFPLFIPFNCSPYTRYSPIPRDHLVRGNAVFARRLCDGGFCFRRCIHSGFSSTGISLCIICRRCEWDLICKLVAPPEVESRFESITEQHRPREPAEILCALRRRASTRDGRRELSRRVAAHYVLLREYVWRVAFDAHTDTLLLVKSAYELQHLLS